MSLRVWCGRGSTSVWPLKSAAQQLMMADGQVENDRRMRYWSATGSEVNALDCAVIELSIQLSSLLKGMRILVVEDSWQVAVALKRLLQTLGAEVVGPVACTGDAERVISELLPDAAIVDINLRAGELAYGLIDHLLDKGVRVVVTSGYSNLSNIPAKVAGILQKPVEAAQLLNVLQTSKTDAAPPEDGS